LFVWCKHQERDAYRNGGDDFLIVSSCSLTFARL